MAASAAQITANRANARLSTGPRTPEGKRASSVNAVSTGLTAAKIFVRPEEQAEFASFKAALLGELRPQGVTQTHHFEMILHAAWNIRRCMILESQIQDEALSAGFDDAVFDDDLWRKLDRVYRYKKMHETTQRRSIADLRLLQTEQLLRIDRPEVSRESVLADTSRAVTRLRPRLLETATPPPHHNRQ